MNPLRVLALLSVVAVSGLSVGCAASPSYRIVNVAPTAGELELHGDRVKAHQLAEGYMAMRCDNGFVIVDEGEAVTGQEMYPGFFGFRKVEDRTEWRVRFQCNDASQASAPNTAPKPQAKIEEVAIPLL